jgi:cytochrome c peroxidase
MKKVIVYLPGTIILVFILAYLLIHGQHSSVESSAVMEERSQSVKYDASPITPIPLKHYEKIEKVRLGEALFNDKRLSHDNSIACSGCHDLNLGGTDRQKVSTGINGALGQLNAPTVFNSGFNFRQFWDGRAESLEAQASGPVHNPIEMGSNWPEVIAKLEQDGEFIQKFNMVYDDGLSGENIVDAIASFERTLITPNSRFDRYLRGDEEALTQNEKEGYQLFLEYGCSSCHQGVNIGGNMYQKLGILEAYFSPVETNLNLNLGRYNVTGREEDKHVFKVPSLRNIALTGPYLHLGGIEKLEDVIKLMAKYQLGRELPEEDIQSIKAFLLSLNGEWQGQLLN